MTSRTGGRNKEGAPEHDRGYRRLFSHPESVEDLLRGFVEEDWVSDLDFSSLEKVDHHFVGDDFGGRASDVIWKMRFRDGERTDSIYVYLLLELQSTSYHFMPVRMLTYSGLLLEQIIRTEKLKTGDLLPAILPFVFNSGRRPWRGPLSLSRLFPPLPRGIEQHLPRLDFLLVDERRLDLTRRGLEGNRLAAAFRIETSPSPLELPRLAQDLDALLPREKDPELRRSYNVWFQSVLRRTFQGVIIRHDFDLGDRSMLEESARKWEKRFLREGREEGLQEGIQKGLQEGIQKGIQKGFREGEVTGLRKALLQILEQRFGPLPDRVRGQLEEITAKSEVERLLQRALKAKSLADIRIAQRARKRNLRP